MRTRASTEGRHSVEIFSFARTQHARLALDLGDGGCHGTYRELQSETNRRRYDDAASPSRAGDSSICGDSLNVAAYCSGGCHGAIHANGDLEPPGLLDGKTSPSR